VKRGTAPTFPGHGRLRRVYGLAAARRGDAGEQTRPASPAGRPSPRPPAASRAPARTLARGAVVAEALFEHRARTPFSGGDDRVFCHAQTGGPHDHKAYATTFRAALARAEVDSEVRPFHDGRHASITNAAAAGVAPAARQARAGHSDLGTTQRYINLEGVLFRQEAEVAEARVFGSSARNR
jgi:integrase